MLSLNAFSQSVEIMPATERFWADVQFLKPLYGDNYKYTVFSRTRSTIDGDDNINMLSSAYFSYSSNIGLGVSLIGNLSNINGLGKAIGINYLKSKKVFSLFAIISYEFDDIPRYSFFSIFKYRPKINNKWSGYGSLELFNVINKDAHLYSGQRIRLGLDYQKLQFGLGTNLGELGTEFDLVENYGVFLRKEF